LVKTDLSQPAVERFFDRFVAAFAMFDAANVASLFATPGVALRKDGSLVPLTTPEDVQKYYQVALDGYRHRGCVSCKWSDLQLTGTGGLGAMAAVTWNLLRADGSALATWRQSYCLAATKDGARIYASAMHAQ
jgi:hypothetical protein